MFTQSVQFQLLIIRLIKAIIIISSEQCISYKCDGELHSVSGGGGGGGAFVSLTVLVGKMPEIARILRLIPRDNFTTLRAVLLFFSDHACKAMTKSCFSWVMPSLFVRSIARYRTKEKKETARSLQFHQHCFHFGSLQFGLK